MKIGIVGLPNVGKSTLFNALLKKQQALVANYPFATIEPNVGVVPVKDPRLDKLAEIVASEESPHLNPLPAGEDAGVRGIRPPIIYATVSFIDIAGLVKGASVGEGLGNKFLSHIREVDAICHVVRHFEDPNVSHVSSEPDPASDLQTVNTELMLADIQTLEKSKTKDKATTQAIDRVLKGLNEGKLVRDLNLTEEELEVVKPLQLLTSKPIFTVANVSEDQLNDRSDVLIHHYKDVIKISAKVEAELAALSEEEQKEYLQSLGVIESGLDKIIKKGYEILNLISFLTAGEKEVRAWTLRRGSTALRASGTIHSDFEKKFIKAEVISYDDFVSAGGWKKSRELGKTRLEGRDYIVKDGEVVEFKIGS